MKKYFLILITVFASTVQASERHKVRIEDVVKRVSSSNYRVYETALKVYQAKANIDKARADLLPRLNIWSIAKTIIDPLSIVDQMGDIAPYLVPSNWFRNQEIKLLYLAESEGYRALWANEVHSAKSLYIHLLFDESLLGHIRDSRDELEVIYRIVKTREAFGGATPGTARDIQIKILGLNEDEQNILVLIQQERDQLTYLLGYSAKTVLDLVPVPMSDIKYLHQRDSNDFEFRVLSQSPERRQFDHFLSVVDQMKNEVKYSFLGASTISRGVAGGVFDSLPIPTGLGFGNGSAMNIVDAQKEIMKTQKTGVEETLRRQLRANIYQYNSDVTNLPSFRERSKLAEESKAALIRRIQLGENINIVDLAEVSRSQIQAETAFFAIQYRILTGQDRLNRLLFAGDYSMNPPLIDSLKGLKK